MKPQGKIEDAIRQMRFQASDRLHDRVWADVRAAQARHGPSGSARGLIDAIGFRRVAVLGCVVIALALITIPAMRSGEVDSLRGSAKTESALETLSMGSLLFAFNEGGMNKLASQLDHSLELVGPRPTELLLEEILTNDRL